MMHQADRGSAPPKRREERQAVFDVDKNVRLAKAKHADKWGSEVLRVGTAGVYDLIVVVGHRSATHQRDAMAALLKTEEYPIHENLGTPRQRVGEIPPRHCGEAQRSDSKTWEAFAPGLERVLARFMSWVASPPPFG